jgi:hypothetical protein
MMIHTTKQATLLLSPLVVTIRKPQIKKGRPKTAFILIIQYHYLKGMYGQDHRCM